MANAEVLRVALLEDTAAQHFETGRHLLLRRGHIGTIVMTYEGRTLEVEFSGRDGRSYALLPIGGSKLRLRQLSKPKTNSLVD